MHSHHLNVTAVQFVRIVSRAACFRAAFDRSCVVINYCLGASSCSSDGNNVIFAQFNLFLFVILLFFFVAYFFITLRSLNNLSYQFCRWKSMWPFFPESIAICRIASSSLDQRMYWQFQLPHDAF